MEQRLQSADFAPMAGCDMYKDTGNCDNQHRSMMVDDNVENPVLLVNNRNSHNDCGRVLSVISYNMHGFNGGYPTVRDYILQERPDIFLLQEHWLTPANLSKFDDHFPQYFCYGSSAMNVCVQEGMLRGRPYGGVMG